MDYSSISGTFTKTIVLKGGERDCRIRDDYGGGLRCLCCLSRRRVVAVRLGRIAVDFSHDEYLDRPL